MTSHCTAMSQIPQTVYSELSVAN